MTATIGEEAVDGGARFILKNARPRSMKVAIMIAAPIALGFIVLAAVGDFRIGRWVMGLVRSAFALLVATATLFTLFGEESVAVAAGELVWQRGKNFERRCHVADIEQLERQGNQLRLVVKDQPPIVIGSGLRQPEAGMVWLTARLEAAIAAAREGKQRTK